jgi:hypothetical protein
VPQFNSGSHLWSGIVSDEQGRRLFAVAGNRLQKDGIYSSEDYGVTWNFLGYEKNWISLATNLSTDSMIAAEWNGELWIWNDSIWTPTQLLLQGATGQWTYVASDVSGLYLAAVAEDDYIWVSLDGGNSWTARGLVKTWLSVSITENGETFVASTIDGEIYASFDLGLTWTLQTSTEKLDFSSIAPIRHDEDEFTGAIHDGRLFYLHIERGISDVVYFAVDRTNRIYRSTDYVFINNGRSAAL